MADLTTLANVKSWLTIATTTDDAILTRMVTSVSNYIQSWLNRSFAVATYTDIHNGSGTGYQLALHEYPIISVSSVTISGNIIPASPDGIQPGYMFDARGIYFNGYQLTKGLQNVRITYSAGYAVTPPEIEQACIELISLRYRERSRIGEVSKSIGGEVISYTQKDFPDGVKTILNNYKRVISYY